MTYSAIANQNDTYAFDVVATYNCFAGFSLVGNNTRNCTGDGSSTTGAFDGIAPICAGRLTQYFRSCIGSSLLQL